jgi:hypothetical protein
MDISGVSNQVGLSTTPKQIAPKAESSSNEEAKESAAEVTREQAKQLQTGSTFSTVA